MLGKAELLCFLSDALEIKNGRDSVLPAGAEYIGTKKSRRSAVPRLQNTDEKRVSMRRRAQHEACTCATSGKRATRYGTYGPSP